MSLARYRIKCFDEIDFFSIEDESDPEILEETLVDSETTETEYILGIQVTDTDPENLTDNDRKELERFELFLDDMLIEWEALENV